MPTSSTGKYLLRALNGGCGWRPIARNTHQRFITPTLYFWSPPDLPAMLAPVYLVRNLREQPFTAISKICRPANSRATTTQETK